jgi:hypothetical protein
LLLEYNDTEADFCSGYYKKLTDPTVWKVVESSGKKDWIPFVAVTLGKRKIADVPAHEVHSRGEHQPEAGVRNGPRLIECSQRIQLRENPTPTTSVASASHLNPLNQRTIEQEQDMRGLSSSTLPSLQEATQADSDSHLQNFRSDDTGGSNEALAAYSPNQNRIDSAVNPTYRPGSLSEGTPKALVSERLPVDFDRIFEGIYLEIQGPPFDFNPIFDNHYLNPLEGTAEVPVSERLPFDFNSIFDNSDLF